MPARRPSLDVAVVAPAAARPATRGLAAWLARVAPRAVRGSVTIALVSDARIRALNQQFRGVDAATDVLSFPVVAGVPADVGRQPASGRAPGPGAAPAELGDIAIARGVAARQARAAGHRLAIELRVLALHGLLHLVGYDHETDDGRMARLETRLRRKGGLETGLIERARRRP